MGDKRLGDTESANVNVASAWCRLAVSLVPGGGVFVSLSRTNVPDHV